MLQSFKYLYDVLTTEISDEITIVSDIITYYRTQIIESFETRKKIAAIEQKMNEANNYQDWKYAGKEYDLLPSVQEKIHEVYSPYYDYSYVEELGRCLREARESHEIDKLISILRSHSSRNIGNMNSPYLYRHAFNQSKKLIQDFQQEYANCLRMISRSQTISNNKKLEFFGEMRHAVGRSALLLSGGAILGMYHIGVCQALMEADCLPRIIAGSSAGSVIASIIATHRRQDFLDGDLYNFSAFATQTKMSLFKQLKRAGREGFVLDIKILERFLRDNIGEYTFQQAYDEFGIILNITVTGTSQHDEDKLLNYLTAPNVLIWSASTASCAIPFIYGATDLFCKDHQGNIAKYKLMDKKYLDGSIGHDLPMDKLSIFFNVNNFIVSQTNPWVIPFMDYTQDFRTITNPVLMRLFILVHRIKQFILQEMKHRTTQLAYIFPSAITKFFNLATQSYVGNVTIWPVPNLNNYMRILENPTHYSSIENFVIDGRHRAYPKIHQISSTQFIQKELTKCYKSLRQFSKINIYTNRKMSGDEQQMNSAMKDIIEDEQECDMNEVRIKREVMKREDEQKMKRVESRKKVKRDISFMVPRMRQPSF